MQGPCQETPGAAEDPGDAFAAARTRIPRFVDETFSLRGTARLHGRAFGWDILRAPANVALAPVHLLTRLLALILRRLGARRLAGAIAARRILLRTGVAREIEVRLVANLFGFAGRSQVGSDLVRVLKASPVLRCLPVSEGASEEARARRAADSIVAYSGVRSAVAEIVTALIALALGAIVFQSLTPGVVSMAPGVAEAMARQNAVSSFPLGQSAGALWYGLFPVRASPVAVVATVAALIAAASCVTAFAGILADPVQARLGIHRRRLLRLVDAVESDLTGSAARPFAAREHYYARFADLVDAASGALRLFR